VHAIQPIDPSLDRSPILKRDEGKLPAVEVVLGGTRCHALHAIQHLKRARRIGQAIDLASNEGCLVWRRNRAGKGAEVKEFAANRTAREELGARGLEKFMPAEAAAQCAVGEEQ